MTTPEEMACRELVDVVSDYLDGRLPADDRRRFEAHLAECPYCLDYLDQMRQTIAAIGELTPDSISPQRRSEVLDAFRGWRDRA